MFDFVRDHSRLALGVMILLIFPSFVFFGIQGYSNATGGGNETVAKVDGQTITRNEWDQAHQRSSDRLRRQMPNVDPKLLETPDLRRETLDNLVRERVLLAAARQMNLTPDDTRLQRLFRTDAQFANLRKPDGSLNADLLASQGMSPAMFEQQLRQEFGMQQVTQAVGQTAFATPAVVSVALDALLQRREVQVQRFDAAAYMGKVSPSEADIEAFYKRNEAQFKAPEQASIEYVVLSLESLSKDLVVAEADAKRFYADNLVRWTQPEERRASHILLKNDGDKKAARAQAEAVLAQVRKAPATFADVARKLSQDPGSAARGGDLDFFGRGLMTKPFEDTVFAMKSGEISGLVETDFGLHIIQLVAVRGGDKKPFEAVRAEIEADLRKGLAQKKFAEAAEQFTNTVYEQPESLQPAIDKFKLQKQTASVQRNPAAGATGALASAKLLTAVFSGDVVNNKRNTDAVEIGAGQLAAARIVQHQPARTLPLADVKGQVLQRVQAEQAAAMARAEGAKRLAEVQKTPTESVGPAVVVSRSQVQSLPRPVMEAVLRADAKKLPAAFGVELGDQGYALVRVTQVLPREAVPGGDVALQQQYTQAWAGAETQAYLNALKKRLKVTVKEDVVAAAVNAASAP